MRISICFISFLFCRYRHIFKKEISCTKRAVSWQPQLVIILRDGFDCYAAVLKEARPFRTQNEKRAGDNRHSFVRLKLSVSSAQGRPGAHYIVNNCKSLPGDP